MLRGWYAFNRKAFLFVNTYVSTDTNELLLQFTCKFQVVDDGIVLSDGILTKQKYHGYYNTGKKAYVYYIYYVVFFSALWSSSFLKAVTVMVTKIVYMILLKQIFLHDFL